MRAITLGFGASVLAMACSFGEIDQGEDVDPDVAPPTTSETTDQPVDSTVEGPTSGPGATPTGRTPAAEDEDYDPANDPFTSEMGKQVADILRVNCGTCHLGASSQGDFGYLLDIDQLITTGKMIPGNKEDSRIYARMVEGTMPPAYYRVTQAPTYGQIDLVGQFIDQGLEDFEDPEGVCEPAPFLDIDQQLRLMQNDMAAQDARDQPFTRYLTVTYSSNAGDCGRSLRRQQYALYKGINSVSTNTVVTKPVAINQEETIFRIDIRDYDWDRPIDLQDNDVSDPANIDFTDGWEAIIANPSTAAYAVEYIGDQADDLKERAGTAVPFFPVNAFIQATEFGDLYYTLIGGRANLFTFELEELGIDTIAEIEDDNLLRAGFENSGVSKQERVLNRFDSNLGPGTSYWISFDFDGGNGGDGANGFEQNVANESIFADPLDFAFAGGEAIFSLPNGMQGYYVAAADGTRLAEAPIGVVIDPAQNNGVVVNGASCHSCHNIGMIPFTDSVRKYVEDNRRDFDNDTYESVMIQYNQTEFLRMMDLDSEMHMAATERAGVPRDAADAISRVYLDFQLGSIDINIAAGELSVPVDELIGEISTLDPRLAILRQEGGYIERNLMTATYLDSLCLLQAVNENQPANCQ